ncbi:hypothetical protein [Dactylosporangium sp. CA-233914]|uniref:hypothetical protein n=1 Tax=Dactylosporangium sp. CA-233914 TaxID=3239934 RepID=UPI003D90CBA5
MAKKIVIAVAAGVLALGAGLGGAIWATADPAPSAPTAESRPANDGQMPAPPAPPQLRPSERVVVIGK